MFKPRPPRVDIELFQVESRINQLTFRLDHAVMGEKERATLVSALAGQKQYAANLRDMIAWEQEMAA